jgi:hypothetical protein
MHKGSIGRRLAAVALFGLATLYTSAVRADDDQSLVVSPPTSVLSPAALRRAWSDDQQIRDFVGLSENFWDINKSDGVPELAVPEEASAPARHATATPMSEAVARPAATELLDVPANVASDPTEAPSSSAPR